MVLKMSRVILVSLFFIIISALRSEDFYTSDGESYPNAKVLRTEPDGLLVRYTDGVVKLKFKNLPNYVCEEYGYNPAEEKTYLKKLGYHSFTTKPYMNSAPRYVHVLSSNNVADTAKSLVPNDRESEKKKGKSVDIAKVLESCRLKYNLPALSGAIFTIDSTVGIAAVGHRRRGFSPLVTVNDQWHLNSCTKVMTATLLGTFVSEGKLSWDDKITSFFPELKGLVLPEFKGLTIADLLNHEAGFAHDLKWWSFRAQDNITQQRNAAVREALTTQSRFGSAQFHYSNVGYVVAGAILERISGQTWEQLMHDRIFSPLDMSGAVFGATDAGVQIDQPWPHNEVGVPAPTNGPTTDHPEVMGPAGRVYCSISDWIKFLSDQLKGANNYNTKVPSGIYIELQKKRTLGDYCYGWITTIGPSQGEIAFTHEGACEFSHNLCWLSPKRRFGVVVCTNQGGSNATKACEDAAAILVSEYLNN